MSTPNSLLYAAVACGLAKQAYELIATHGVYVSPYTVTVDFEADNWVIEYSNPHPSHQEDVLLYAAEKDPNQALKSFTQQILQVVHRFNPIGSL